MKTNQQYWTLSAVAAITAVGMSFGAISYAQTVPTLTCSLVATTVTTNQAEILTATGGNGTYSWSGANLDTTNSTANKFAVNFPTPGTYTVTVASAGQTANCSIHVVAAPVTNSVGCSPVVQSVALGEAASFSAAGGNGAYVWTAPDLNITNGTGPVFTAKYASSGLKILTVTSAGLSASCATNVLGSASTPPSTPGLPNTGGGYKQ